MFFFNFAKARSICWKKMLKWFLTSSLNHLSTAFSCQHIGLSKPINQIRTEAGLFKMSTLSTSSEISAQIIANL